MGGIKDKTTDVEEIAVKRKRSVCFLSLLNLIKDAQPDCCCYSTCAVRLFLPQTADAHVQLHPSQNMHVVCRTNWSIESEDISECAVIAVPW